MRITHVAIITYEPINTRGFVTLPIGSCRLFKKGIRDLTGSFRSGSLNCLHAVHTFFLLIRQKTRQITRFTGKATLDTEISMIVEDI